MNSKLIALFLLITTGTAIAVMPNKEGTTPLPVIRDILPAAPIPALTNQVLQPEVEVVFVLDTTGSMGGLIGAAKEKIWSIATTLATANGAPRIKMGIVAYRDRGDAYVTRQIDLSADLDMMYSQLMDLEADGGGDGPESVNQALHEAVNQMSWSNTQGTYRAIFLVGDAAGHQDYQNDIKYPTTIKIARQKGIVVNSIQCGGAADTAQEWQHIAGLGDGSYFQVEQAGNAIAIATPFDVKLAELSAKLDDTRMTFGDRDVKRLAKLKNSAIDKIRKSASTASLARRAAFNATESGETNMLGEGDLVDAISSGEVDLDSLSEEQLPEELKVMAPQARQEKLDVTIAARQDIQQQIKALSGKRSGWLKDEVSRTGSAESSLDEQIYSAVKEQAQRLGLVYEAESAEY